MNNKEIEKEMYHQATEFLKQRFPKGWGGVGIVHTNKDHYFISVAPETANASATLCIETGAIIQAHTYNERITHCLCVVRDDENSPFKILSPCGICQERLKYFGDNVEVAVTEKSNNLFFVPLKKLQPYHWTEAYPKDRLEHFVDKDN